MRDLIWKIPDPVRSKSTLRRSRRRFLVCAIRLWQIKKDGMPIPLIDPVEGNYALTESVAVIDKKKKTNPLAMEMAECIVKYAREELLRDLSEPTLRGGETVK